MEESKAACKDMEKFPPLNVKPGDKVWSARYGIVTVLRVDDDVNEQYRITLDGEANQDSYTINGFYSVFDKFPSLFVTPMVMVPEGDSYLCGTFIRAKEPTYVAFVKDGYGKIYTEKELNNFLNAGLMNKNATIFLVDRQYSIEEKITQKLKHS